LTVDKKTRRCQSPIEIFWIRRAKRRVDWSALSDLLIFELYNIPNFGAISPMNFVSSMPPRVISAWPTDFGVRYKLYKAMVGRLEKLNFWGNFQDKEKYLLTR
jgi:hypothetical protein